MDSQRSTVIIQDFLANPKNRESFGRFAAKYQPRIKNICMRRGLQEVNADELTAGMLLRFFERDIFERFVFQSKARFYGWLERVVLNDVRTFLRNESRKPDSWSLGNADAQAALEQTAESVVHDLGSVCEEDLAAAEAACTRVRERLKEEKTWSAFSLSVFDELDADEISKRLGMTKPSVYKAVSRVKQMLREELPGLHGPLDSI